MNAPSHDRCESRSVLFAMNDLTAAHAFAQILELRSHRTRIADTELEALECSGRSIVIAEFGELPDGSSAIDGLELIHDLRALGANPSVVLIATNPTAEQVRRAVQMGASDILVRPLLPEDLVHAVESAVQPAPLLEDIADSHSLQSTLAAASGAAEAAARDVIGWCARCEVAPPARARIGTAIAEVVQNSVDHGASEVQMTASISGTTLDVELVDDGPGFDTVATLTEGVLDASTGLGRVYSLAETVNVRSQLGEGTRVSLRFRVSTIEFDDGSRIDLSDLDYFVSATSKELLATLSEDPNAPIVLSPALAVVVGRLLVGPDQSRILQEALRS